MILIPSPYVASNHQEYNAMELVNKQAAKMIKETELTSDRLIEEIDTLFNDTFTLVTMKENAKKLGKVNACADISKVMMELIGK